MPPVQQLSFDVAEAEFRAALPLGEPGAGGRAGTISSAARVGGHRGGRRGENRWRSRLLNEVRPYKTSPGRDGLPLMPRSTCTVCALFGRRRGRGGVPREGRVDRPAEGCISGTRKAQETGYDFCPDVCRRTWSPAPGASDGGRVGRSNSRRPNPVYRPEPPPFTERFFRG